MQREMSLRQKLKQRDPMIGSILTLPSPEIAEILSLAGLDWLFIDMEHGLLTLPDVQRAVQAVSRRVYCVVRAPSGDDVWLKRILDTGADGVLIPRVNSADETREIVRNCKYPPEGRRSVGIARAHGYGVSFGEYVASANADIAVVIQIEDIVGVRDIEAIVRVDGVDAIFLGPYDLSGSMGKPGRVNDADVKEQIETVRKACDAAGMPIGIFGVDGQAVRPCIAQGYTLNAVGMDTVLLQKTVREMVDGLKAKI